ncbi:MAG: hypothetical protein Q9205_001872 [Flavoplaca limonia]
MSRTLHRLRRPCLQISSGISRSEALEWNRSRRSFLKAMCLDEKRVEKPDGKTLGMTEDEKSKELIVAPATDEIGRDRQVLDPFDVEDPNNWFSILSVRPVRAIKVLASVPMDEDFGDDAEIAAVADAAEKKRNAAKPSASSEKPKKVQQPAPQALRKRTEQPIPLAPFQGIELCMPEGAWLGLLDSGKIPLEQY